VLIHTVAYLMVPFNCSSQHRRQEARPT